MNDVYYAPMQSTIKFTKKEDNKQYVVGSYANTILIRTEEDRFVPFQCTIKKLSSSDFPTLSKIVNEYSTNSNIIVEDNSKLFIAKLASLLKDNFLIYHLQTKSCITIYEYVEKMFQIPSYVLNLYQIIQLLNANVLITQCFRNNTITWNSKLMIDTILNSQYELFYTVIQKYLEKFNKVAFESNATLVKELTMYIKQYFDTTDNFTVQFEQFTKQITSNDLYNVIKLLANS